MTELATKQRFLVTQPLIAGGANTVTELAPKPALSTELEQAREVAKLARRDFDVMTRGIERFNPHLSQIVAKTLRPGHLVGSGVALVVGGFIAGGITGAITAGLGFNLPTQNMAAASVFGACIALEGVLVCLGLGALGISKLQAKRRVTQNEVMPSIHRFQAGEGSAKGLVGELLTRWLRDLHHAEVLTPEAAESLEQVQGGMKELPLEERSRAAVMSDLVRELEKSTPVTADAVANLHTIVDRFPKEEREELATLLRDIVRNSGRKLDYQGEHALHKLPKQYAAEA
jgi:hypothetical protein